MSCGTKITGHSIYEIADKLEMEGEYNLSYDIRHGRCLDHYDLRKAERALENQGMRRFYDFRETDCECRLDD